MSLNRLYNIGNPYQRDFKRVLCVCSAGLLRSPTAALVLSMQPYNFNTRAVGIDEGHALILIDDVLVSWAQEIVCMQQWHLDSIKSKFAGVFEVFKAAGNPKTLLALDISDNYAYRDEALLSLIGARYDAVRHDAR